MRRDNLPRDVRIAIENEIRKYRVTKAVLDERRAQIQTSSSAKADGVDTCLCSRDLARMERVCLAIEDIYRILSAEGQRVIELYYWRPMRQCEVTYEIGVSERTLRRMRREIVSLLAYRLGIIKPAAIPRVPLESAPVKR